MFKLIRILILLMILFGVIGTYLVQRDVAQDWNGTLRVQIIPVLADDKANTKRFVASLDDTDFAEIEKYLIRQAKRFGRDLSVGFDVKVLAAIDQTPPLVPPPSSSALSKMLWSLKLRWWSWQNSPGETGDSIINLYVLYQSPLGDQALPHSTGLQNGLIGLINARAKARDKRLHNVILVHELMYILGASDKYDLQTGEPLYPHGYANPNLAAGVAQNKAEIMGRARPIGNGGFDVARVLARTLVGSATAKEIGWL